MKSAPIATQPAPNLHQFGAGSPLSIVSPAGLSIEPGPGQHHYLHQPGAQPSRGAVNTSSTAATPEFDRDWFTYRGRDWRIFKRGEGQRARWYLYFEHHRKRYKHSLGEVSKAAAIATAKIKIDAVLGNFHEVLKASMQRPPAAAVCTVGEILRAYETMTLDIGEQTRCTNLNCFRLVLREAVSAEEVDSLSAGVLSSETAQRYFEVRLKRAQAARDQGAAARIKRSANSIFNQAKSVLRPKAVAGYRRLGLALPEQLDGFSQAYAQEKFDVISNAYNPPVEAVTRKTLHEWLKLRDRNMFIAVGLALACGLRKEEIRQTTWGMFTRDRYGALLDGRGWVKNQTGRFEVQPIDPFWQLLNRGVDKQGWRGKPDELVLVGHETERSDLAFRRVGEWLRSLGWTTQKTNHALRAYAGSLVAMKFRLDDASRWLRHQSLAVTQAHYTHFVSRRRLRRETIRIAWAR